MGIGLVPWSVAGKTDKITLDNKHVMVILEPKREMETNYLSSITGLKIVRYQVIIGDKTIL